MRDIPNGLAGHLAQDATTLCHCWRLTRRDGAVLGFTDHDRDLVAIGTVFQAASGFAASDTEEESGLSVPTSEVAGGFSSEAIAEADLISGRYDGARVEVFLVNWQAPGQHLLLKVQEIGEVKREAGQFSAELRSFAHRLTQEQGRIFSRRCDAALGDARCGVDLDAPGRSAEGVVAAVEAGDRLVVSGLSGFADGYFRHGRLTLTGGTNAGVTAGIDDSRATGSGMRLVLWLPLETLPEPGDAVRVTVGCDKAFATCRETFANQANFRGFPHMPGSDFAYSYADGETTHDGSVLFE